MKSHKVSLLFYNRFKGYKQKHRRGNKVPPPAWIGLKKVLPIVSCCDLIRLGAR